MLPDGCPTGPKRPDSRDGRPNPCPRRLTKSEGQETLGAETRRERDEGDGVTTGDREDTPSTLRLEPPDPDGARNYGGSWRDYSPRWPPGRRRASQERTLAARN